MPIHLIRQEMPRHVAMLWIHPVNPESADFRDFAPGAAVCIRSYIAHQRIDSHRLHITRSSGETCVEVRHRTSP
ncbi:MAG: hypothetical protein JWN34_5282 [Bryobacterales bacterium]|nr:hypothetical protein [Bryobacterales bacterium]